MIPTHKRKPRDCLISLKKPQKMDVVNREIVWDADFHVAYLLRVRLFFDRKNQGLNTMPKQTSSSGLSVHSMWSSLPPASTAFRLGLDDDGVFVDHPGASRV